MSCLNSSAGCQGGEAIGLRTESGVAGPADRELARWGGFLLDGGHMWREQRNSQLGLCAPVGLRYVKAAHEILGLRKL